MKQHSRVSLMALLAGVLAGCGAPEAATSEASDDAPERSAAAAPSVAPTGRVITVEMFTDGAGNYYRPARIEAHRGDIVRFVLRSGVHNVHFLPDSNPGRSGLPPVSEFLQIPDQTWDLLVTMAPGDYYFQCDPHALLGMVGRLEVEDDE